MYFQGYGTRNMCSDKCIEGPVSQDPSTSIMVNDPKHCSNPNDSAFIIFIDHSEVNWV